ncbi:MAG: phosphohistidine phosphatase SixA [Marinomonas colpomeniae]
MMQPKRIYILRHGNAEPYSATLDEQRQLTELGVAEVESTARAFSDRCEFFDAVFVSPYIRAQQTSKVFLAAFDSTKNVVTSSLITPYGNVMDVAAWLVAQPYQSILLITHQPFAYQLVEYLADEVLPTSVSMSTATLVSLEGELLASACCQFRWCISPLELK